MKRFYILLIAAIVLIGGGIVYVIFFSGSNVFKAVPKSAVAAIQVKDWKLFLAKLKNTNEGEQLEKAEAFNKLVNGYNSMLNLFSYGETLPVELNSDNVVASLHVVSASGLDFLYTVRMKGVNDNDLINNIKGNKQVKTVSVRLYKGQKVVDLQMMDGRQITFAKLRDYLAFSSTAFLVEASVSALLSNDGIGSDKGFKKALANVSKSGEALVFYDFQKTEILLPVIVAAGQAALFSNLSHFAGWGAYNLSFKSKQGVLLSGYAYTEQADKKETVSDDMFAALQQYIPDNVAAVDIAEVDTSRYDDFPDDAVFFRNWVGKARVFMTIEPLQQEFSNRNICIINITDKAEALSDLKRLLVKTGSPINPVDTFNGIPIYRIKSDGIINRVFSNRFSLMTDEYFLLKDDMAFFAGSSNILKLAIEKGVKKELVEKETGTLLNTAPQQIVNVYPSRLGVLSNILFSNSPGALGFINGFSKITVKNIFRKKLVYSEVALLPGKGTATGNGLIWQTTLKGDVEMQPMILDNTGEGEKEFFVQDTTNNIYLISQSGDIIFTRNINEKLEGKVFLLDYYHNGTLQYIFTGERHVYVLDRNGNNVGAYPLRLSYPTAAGLILAEDRAKSNYNYFVSCLNGAVYGYNINGKPLAGWAPKAGVGDVDEMWQFDAHGQTNLAIYTSAGTLAIFDGAGSKKWVADNLGGPEIMPVMVKCRSGIRFLAAQGAQLTEISQDGNDETFALQDSVLFFGAINISDSTYVYYYSNGEHVVAENADHTLLAALPLSNFKLCGTTFVDDYLSGSIILHDCISNRGIVLDKMLKTIGEFTSQNGYATIYQLKGGSKFLIKPGPNAIITGSRINN